MRGSSEATIRIILGKQRENVTAALAYLDDYRGVVGAFADTLRRAFHGRASPVKELACAANINVRTAENLKAGRSAPSALVMLKLMASVPEFAAEVRRLTGMHADLDPEFERDLHKLMQTYAARRQ